MWMGVGINSFLSTAIHLGVGWGEEWLYTAGDLVAMAYDFDYFYFFEL